MRGDRKDIGLKLIEGFDQSSELKIPKADVTSGVTRDKMPLNDEEPPNVTGAIAFQLFLGLLLDVEDTVSRVELPLFDAAICVTSEEVFYILWQIFISLDGVKCQS
jgi:hypothetical protein